MNEAVLHEAQALAEKLNAKKHFDDVLDSDSDPYNIGAEANQYFFAEMIGTKSFSSDE